MGWDKTRRDGMGRDGMRKRLRLEVVYKLHEGGRGNDEERREGNEPRKPTMTELANTVSVGDWYCAIETGNPKEKGS